MGVTMMTGRRVALECRGGCHGGYHGTTRGVSGNLYGVPWDTVARHGMPRGCHGMAWVVSLHCHRENQLMWNPGLLL